MEYRKLFEPGRIGAMTLKNRAVMMPMATDLADKDGLPTPRQIRYYQERAKGGVAMIIHEYTGVDDVDSIPSIHNLRVARDYHISALEELTDAVHLYDCRIVAQIHHGGATSNPNFTGRQNLAPSAVPIAEGRPVPKEMTLEDIKRVEQKFIDAAVRCRKAGYDAVELHGAHGYLIAQFFSKYYNRRTDEYGGSVENRCRFVREIIEGIRAKLGPKFPILVRMCGDEMTPVDGFLTLEDGLEIAKYLESLGIDAINISNGSARNGDANCEPFSYQPGWKKHVAKAYKEALSIPVIATNTIKNPEFAEQLLEEGVSDFVGLGRSQLADPEFMNKARAGRSAEIRKCIGCLYCRERVIGGGMPMRCAVNARTGREIDFPRLHRNGRGQTVAVIGGGPAGMEAARVLALRGFRPVLFEKEESLGGTLNIADKPALKDKITAMVDSLKAELTALDVDVRLGVEATPALVRELSPAGVIVTCGAEPLIPPIPGIDGANVLTAEAFITGKSTLVPAKSSGPARVAVIGSGLTGLETSEMLISQGYKVSIIEMLPDIGPGIFPAIRNDELSRILPHEPDLYPGHQLLSIREHCVTVKNLASGEIFDIPADYIVLAMGVRPRTALVQEFREAFDGVDGVGGIDGIDGIDGTDGIDGVNGTDGADSGTGKVFVTPVRAAGDARQGGRIATAIREGFEVAYLFEA